MTSTVEWIGADEDFGHAVARYADATAPGARIGFRRYVAELLGALVGEATFLQDGEAVYVDGFRLRRHHADAPVYALTFPSQRTLRLVESSQLASPVLLAFLRSLLRVTVPRCLGRPCPRASWFSPLGVSGIWTQPDPPHPEDFTFGYSVPPAELTPRSVPELAAAIIYVLMDSVDLVASGRTVFVDEVLVGGVSAALPEPDLSVLPQLGARTEVPGANTQPLHTVAATEPTIVTLGRHWALLEGLITPGIDSFALFDLTEWLSDSDCYPSEIYEYLARVCNVACQFCYLFGNPDQLAVARGKKVIAASEMETRMKYFRPDLRSTLFKAQWEINEFLVDPKLADVLRELRRRTDKEFYFITNGSPLLPRVIDLLDEVRPVTLIVSTNTIDAPLRAQVMNERRTQTETALSCLERLAEREIPFGLSFVATPEFPASRLAEAMAKLEPLRPAMVRVNLPGFTRDHPYALPFDTDTLWDRAAREIAALRAEFRTPIAIIPSAYEADLLYADPHEPRIIGTVPGSPADAAGLLPGDRVEQIGFFPVGSRSEIQSLLMAVSRPTKIKVLRQGTGQVELTLDPHAPTSYPYSGHLIGKYVVPYGLVVAPSLSRSDARAIEAAIAETGARRPWVMTSPLMVDQASAFAARWLPEYALDLHFCVVRNEFLGGNITVLDMATVGDVHAALVAEFERTGTRPDLVLLPGSGFNQEGRDLAGRHWGDLERALGISVRLLDGTTQFLF